MLCANTGFAVPEKILNRSSFTTLAPPEQLKLSNSCFGQSRKLTVKAQSQKQGKVSRVFHLSPFFQLLTVDCSLLRRDAEAESTTRLQTTLRGASNERTCRARHSRKRRSGRAETQQRLGAPSLGSGKLQTPPNRYPPARLLQLLFGAIPA